MEGPSLLLQGMLVAPGGLSSPPRRDFQTGPCGCATVAQGPHAVRLSVPSGACLHTREGIGVCWGMGFHLTGSTNDAFLLRTWLMPFR